MDAYVYLRKNHKLLKTMTVVCHDDASSYDKIMECLEPILVPWDIPRPILIERHSKDLDAFGRVIFRPSDFIESFPYDQLEVELSARPEGIPEDMSFFDEFF